MHYALPRAHDVSIPDSMSVATDLERCLPRPRYEPPSLFDQPFHPNGTFYHDEYIELITRMQNPATETLDQLARLHQMYKSKLSITNQNKSKPGVRCQSLSLSDVFENNVTDCNEFVAGNCSIYSEPAYRPPKDAESMCNSCKKDLNKAENAERILRMQKFCDKLTAGTKRNISSLRHPDGASNPSLDEEEKKERVPGLFLFRRRRRNRKTKECHPPLLQGTAPRSRTSRRNRTRKNRRQRRNCRRTITGKEVPATRPAGNRTITVRK